MSGRETETGNYLHECHQLHACVTEIHYGRRQNLAQIQKATEAIKKRHRLTYEDLETIRNSDVWDANQFGYWPSRAEIEADLKKWHWNFQNLHRNRQASRERENATIDRLLKIFHQIEAVSVIMRFVDPRRYGILSPPVELVLGIGPSRSHATKYSGYLDDLQKLKEAHGFNEAAEVDMALWALQVGVVEGRLKDRLDTTRYRALRDGFEQDQVLRSIRMANLSPQLFQDMPRLDLAEALRLADNLEMAGQIAGCEFERRVAMRLGIAPEANVGLRDLVEEAWPDSRRRYKYNQAVSVRNRAVHRQGVTSDEVQSLSKRPKTYSFQPIEMVIVLPFVRCLGVLTRCRLLQAQLSLC